MLFNSVSFAIFLPIVFLVYWVLPQNKKWILLLLASYYFYMSWNPKYVVLILLTTTVSYFAALGIEKAKNTKEKKTVLIIAVVFCLGVLFLFKYFNFFSESVILFLRLFSIQLHPLTLKILLPVGISFYTFQSLSYVIDVYRGSISAEKHFGIYATFISFFPQLVAGPIERSNNLLPQIKMHHEFDYSLAMDGIKLMMIGFYKKLVIADIVAVYVDQIYADVYSFKGFDLALVIFLFSMQIYCDFSGYSDIAIGTSKLFGINLMNNFMSPYFAISIKDFWSRWHISLSTWFKDYVYIPLGGNRCSMARRNANLLITFLLSGLWHGANWTYVLWGGFHGLAQIIENSLSVIFEKIRTNKVGKWLSIVVVFLFCNFAWVFFRADNLEQALYVITHSVSGILRPSDYFHSQLELSKLELSLMFASMVPLAIFDFLNINGKCLQNIHKLNKYFKWLIYIAVGIMVILLSQKGVAAEFVYFQF